METITEGTPLNGCTNSGANGSAPKPPDSGGISVEDAVAHTLLYAPFGELLRPAWKGCCFGALTRIH